MEASVRSLPRNVPAAPTAARPGFPAHVAALVFASLSVIVGVYWDVSWHRSIGRDTFWSAPHLAIYLGGVVSGITCAWVVLRTSFAGTAAERAASVRFWRFFRGPLGAWVAIWGAIAMLTSAPFDDWWHNAYGLDVEILSPPHIVLALGIWSIQLGALLLVLARQNREEDPRLRRRFQLAYAATAGLVLLNVAIISWEYNYRELMHRPIFYQVAGGVYPLFLIGMAYASTLRWRFTAAAAVYTGVLLAMVWILPLFPATPKLGPISHPIDHMVAPDFPILLLAPALAMDWIVNHWGGGRRWLLALVLGATFFAALLAVQWLFAEFLLSPGAQNRFFGTPYTQGYNDYRSGTLRRIDGGIAAELRGFAIALGITVASARLGLAWGGWMREVRR